MSTTINDQQFRKQHVKKLTPHQEIAQLLVALRAAPHSENCPALTPRPKSISAYFSYRPPACTCHKSILRRYTDEDIKSDHEFKY